MTFKEKIFNCGKGAVTFAYCNISQAILDAHDNWEANKLIDKAYSPRRNTRIIAKAKLKKFYPEILEVIQGSETQ